MAEEEITEISRGLGLWDNSVMSHMESQFAIESWNLANHLERTVKLSSDPACTHYVRFPQSIKTIIAVYMEDMWVRKTVLFFQNCEFIYMKSMLKLYEKYNMSLMQILNYPYYKDLNYTKLILY